MPIPKKTKTVTPYFTEGDADQIRAAVNAVGHLEGYASITELVEGPPCGSFGGCSENTTEAGNGPASRPARCGQAGEPARKVNTERKTGALASHLPDNDGGLICADTSCADRSGMPIFRGVVV